MKLQQSAAALAVVVLLSVSRSAATGGAPHYGVCDTAKITVCAHSVDSGLGDQSQVWIPNTDPHCSYTASFRVYERVIENAGPKFCGDLTTACDNGFGATNPQPSNAFGSPWSLTVAPQSTARTGVIGRMCPGSSPNSCDDGFNYQEVNIWDVVLVSAQSDEPLPSPQIGYKSYSINKVMEDCDPLPALGQNVVRCCRIGVGGE
jgi:hypothetical protein